MKKALSLLLAGALSVGLLAGCGQTAPSSTASTGASTGTSTSGAAEANKTIDTLRIAFVPSREPDEIITATEPLKQLLTDELAKLGYDVTVFEAFHTLGGVLGCEHTAAVQMLELRVAPDTGQHDKGRKQGGENQNGPFLLHGDASPCRCAKNKVYYSISNRAKKGEG